MGLFDKVNLKVRNVAIGKASAILLKMAAEGRFFVFPKQAAWVYWHLRGIKGTISLAFGFATALIMLLDSYGVCDLAAAHWSWFRCDVWASHIAAATGSVSGIFLYLSQVDGGLNLGGPELSLEDVMDEFKVQDMQKRIYR